MLRPFSILAIVVASAVAGCTDTPVDAGDGAPPFPAFGVRTSIDTSTNAKLLPALQQLSGFHSIFDPFSGFRSLPSKRSGDAWTWTRAADSLKETVIATRKPGGGFGWTRTLNGVKGGVTFTNWIASLGSTNANGTAGSWTMNSSPADSLSSTLDWSTDSLKALLATLQNLRGLHVLGKHVTTSRPDLSGWLRNFSDSVTIADRWVWQMSGHGSYFTYPFPGDTIPNFIW